jgi:hypothetical protein
MRQIAEQLGYQVVRAIGRATKEGVKQADIGDTGLDVLQLPDDEKSAAVRAIDRIRKDQQRTPGGALLNRGMLSQLYAETLPTAQYDPAAAEYLAKQQIDLIKMEMQRGKSLDQARETSVKYIKGLGIAGFLTDAESGLFDEKKAQTYLDAIKTIAPSIGKELTGDMFYQLMKYARSSRYTQTPEGMQAALLAAEEMGGSSAGVALNQAVRQLAGQNVPKKTLNELVKLGLVTTEEVPSGAVGKKKKTETVVKDITDEDKLRSNLWQFARETLVPKMQAEGLDPNKPLDVAKFASRISSTATARDIITGAINRWQEIKIELDRAAKRDPKLAVDPKSLMIAVGAVQSQLQGVLGEAVTAFEPILLPAIKGVTDYLSDLGGDIRTAAQGKTAEERAAAQIRVEGTAAKAATLGALGLMARGPISQAISAISTPVGITAGIAGAVDPAASPTAKSLALAGVGLNAAAQGLQAAAGAQLEAAGKGGLIDKLMPWLGRAFVIGLGATAESVGPGGTGYDYGQMNAEAQKLARDLTVPQAALFDLAKELKLAEENLVSARKVQEAFPDRTGPLGDIKAAEDKLAEVQTRIAKAKAEEARIQEALDLATGKKDPMMRSFWDWLEKQYAPQIVPPGAQPKPAVPPGTTRLEAGKVIVEGKDKNFLYPQPAIPKADLIHGKMPFGDPKSLYPVDIKPYEPKKPLSITVHPETKAELDEEPAWLATYKSVNQTPPTWLSTITGAFDKASLAGTQLATPITTAAASITTAVSGLGTSASLFETTFGTGTAAINTAATTLSTAGATAAADMQSAASGIGATIASALWPVPAGSPSAST